METRTDSPQGTREKAFTQGLSTTAKHRGLHTHSSDFISTKRPGGAVDHVGGRQNKAGTRCVGFQLT